MDQIALVGKYLDEKDEYEKTLHDFKKITMNKVKKEKMEG